MRKCLFSRVLIFFLTLPSSPLIPSFLLHHQSFKRATVHSHFFFLHVSALPQSPLFFPPNPAKKTFNHSFPERGTPRTTSPQPGSPGASQPPCQNPLFPLQPTAMNERASKIKPTYCYGLQPFLVQLCFRHPGEKDTGGERGRRVGRAARGKGTKKANKNKSTAHTAVTQGELEQLQSEPRFCVVVSHFWRHRRLAHGRIILVTGPVPALLPVSQLCC